MNDDHSSEEQVLLFHGSVGEGADCENELSRFNQTTYNNNWMAFIYVMLVH